MTKHSPEPPAKTGYHHGDLQSALLAAAEAELVEHGLEAFSLRGVAKRAGVSHAAPAHHFGTATGLLSALAAAGFERFVATQRARQAKAAADPQAQLTASGLGYIAFALANPALFRLMFSSGRPDFSDPHLGQAAAAAYDKLVGDVVSACGLRGEASQEAVTGAWALVHGLADLMISGRLPHLSGVSETERERALTILLERSLAGLPGGARATPAQEC